MNTLRLIPILTIALASCSAQRSSDETPEPPWRRISTDRSSADRAVQDDFDATTDLSGLLKYARSHNPGLKAAFQSWRQAIERIPQATALPNPRLSLSSYLAEVETRVGPMQGRVGVTQSLPWFGELELAGDAASAAANAAREHLETARLGMDYRLRTAWYEYVWLEEAIVVTEGNQELLLHWESVARARFETGLGRHSDVIRAQVELGKLEDRAQTLTDLRRPLEAKLNAALGRPPAAAVPRPSTPLSEPPVIDEGRLASELVSTSPVLRAMRYTIEAAHYGVELAKKAFYPDFFIGADYTLIGSAASPSVSGSGDDAVSVTLGFDLPVRRDSYRAGLREHQARVKRTRADHDETLNRLSADLEMALYRFRDAHRRVQLFRDSLIPKGEESIKAVDTAYQSGDGGFLDLIDAQRVLLEFQLEAATAESDRAKALAEIERITGIPLQPEG